MNYRSKFEEQIRKIQKIQKQNLQGLVKPLYDAFHGGKAKARLDIAVKKIKADKIKKDKEEKDKVKKAKKEKK